jgi:hypothetical protein
VVFAALNKGTQPRVAVLPGFFRGLYTLWPENSSRTGSPD